MVDSLIVGIKERGRINVTTYETGDVQLMSQAYWDNEKENLLDKTFKVDSDIKALVRSFDWDLVARLIFPVEMILRKPDYLQDGSLQIQVLAIEKGDYLEHIASKDLIRSAQIPSEDTNYSLNQDEVWISSWFASKLGADIGDPVLLVARGKGGFFEQLELTISGIYETTNPNIDRAFLIVSYSTADFYLDLRGAYTELNLYKDTRNYGLANKHVAQGVKKIQAEIQNELIRIGEDHEIRVASLDEVQQQRGTTSWNYPRSISSIYMILIFVLAAAGIANTVRNNLESRKREIGTFQAFGMSSRQILTMFLIEAALVGVIGGVLGWFVSIGPNWLLADRGIDYTVMMQETTFDLPISGVFRGVWAPETYVVSALLAIMFTVCISWLVLLGQRKKYQNIIALLRSKS